ncbi:hypothetical protein, partial [Nocardia mangyaensis]|uniref:hypothetical protein n=1 Tax=Nocardia mangyaensis TaxID=2213200 RepID=UPI0026749DD4
MSFKTEFENARKLGKKTFEYKGKLYNTQKKDESKSQWESTLSKKTTNKIDKKIDYGKNKKDDAELRDEIKSFVDSFNSKYGTDIKVSPVHGAEHRKKGEFGRKTINHVKFGGTDFIASGSKKDQELFMDHMASSGFRVIDERKAKGSRG